MGGLGGVVGFCVGNGTGMGDVTGVTVGDPTGVGVGDERGVRVGDGRGVCKAERFCTDKVGLEGEGNGFKAVDDVSG